MERKEMQPLVSRAVIAALQAAKVPVDGPHMRRLVRVLVRLATRIAIEAGFPMKDFMPLVAESIAKESADPSPASHTITSQELN